MNTHPKQKKVENNELFPKSTRASTICSSFVVQAGELSIFDFVANQDQSNQVGNRNNHSTFRKS
jgi:hypothetical protein